LIQLSAGTFDDPGEKGNQWVNIILIQVRIDGKTTLINPLGPNSAIRRGIFRNFSEVIPSLNSK
jgi:hypothetical protein